MLYRKIGFLFLLVFSFGCTDETISSFELENSVKDNSLKTKESQKFTGNNLSTVNFNYAIKKFREFNYLGNDPHQADWPFPNGAQGLANDGQNWFLTTNEIIYKWNASFGFPTSSSNYSSAYMPSQISDYNHYGDADYDNNILYVPLEINNKSLPPKLVVFDSNLNYVDSDILSKNAQSQYNNETPWVSVNPISKHIYSSKFNNVSEIWVYEDLDSSDNLDLNYLGPLTLKTKTGAPLTLSGVQGGEFSNSGHLFLFAQSSGPNGMGMGIYVFDESTGKLLNHKYAQYETSRGQEFEGITIWDHDNSSVSSPYGGQVHAMVYQKHIIYGNKFWLKHFRIQKTTEIVTPLLTNSYLQNGQPYLEWADLGNGYNYTVREIDYRNFNESTWTTSNNSMMVSRFLLEENAPTPDYYKVEYSIQVSKNGYISEFSDTVSYYYQCSSNPRPGCIILE